MNEQNIKNIPEAKTLVKQYRKITIKKLEKLQEEHQWSDRSFSTNALHEITGFGSISTCNLCKSLNINEYGFSRCKQCIYGYNSNRLRSSRPPCEYGKEHKSYYAIYNAKTAKELIKAVKNRANVLEGLIKSAESKLKENKKV